MGDAKFILKIDDNDLSVPKEMTEKPKVYIYNGDNASAGSTNAPPIVTLNVNESSGVKSVETTSRFAAAYLQNVNTQIIHATNNTGDAAGKWKLANETDLTNVINDTGTEPLVIVCQIAIIKSLTATAVTPDNMAVVQFPIYLKKINDDADAKFFGGRRRTKANKGKSSYHTRKQKKQRETK